MAKKKKKMKDTVKKALGISIFVLILGGIMLSVILDNRAYINPDTYVGNTAGNLNNGGKFCDTEKKVFFSNAYDNGSLYIMNPDETGLKRVSGIRASYINADEHFVYFESNDLSAASGLGGLAVPSIGIFKMNHGGGKSGNIVRENVRGLTLIGNNIYYVKDTKETGITFNSMDVNKKEETLLLKQEVNPGCTDGRNIYFTNFATDMGLYRYDVTTGGMSMVTAERAYNPQIQGEYIYYMDIADDYHICRMKMSDGTSETLGDDRVDMFLVVGGKIFYQKSSQDSPALMIMNTDGSGASTVMEGVYKGLSAAGYYVYFYTFNDDAIYHVSADGTGVGEFTAAREAAEKNR